MSYISKLIIPMITGLTVTLEVFIITLIFSLLLGIVVALIMTSKLNFIKRVTGIYIWIMRGTPLLLQLIVIFFGLPLIHITFSRLTAALIAFIFNYGAYFGEIFRGGIEGIDRGQYEASELLGLTSSQTFTRIIFPQVIKRTLPPIGNEVINLIKDTSLVYVVGLGELLRAGKIASNRDASLVPLIVVGVLYLTLNGFLTKVFKILENRYSYYR